jgi:hypothetical protein
MTPQEALALPAAKKLLEEVIAGPDHAPHHPDYVTACFICAGIAALRAAIDKTPSPVFLPQDIERIYAGESLPLVPRHVLRDLLTDPDEADR